MGVVGCGCGRWGAVGFFRVAVVTPWGRLRFGGRCRLGTGVGGGEGVLAQAEVGLAQTMGPKSIQQGHDSVPCMVEVVYLAW